MERLFRRYRRRGLSLIELVIAAGIFTSVMAGIMYLLLAVMRQERSNISMLNMAYESTNLHRELRKVASNGANIQAAGDTVQFTNTVTGTTAELRYVDSDDDPATIRDNSIVYDPDTSTSDDEQTILRYVSPLDDGGGTSLPVFRRIAGTPSPLLVEFRVGDRGGPLDRNDRPEDDDARADDAYTGPGVQSMVFRGAYMPRVR